MSNFIFNENNVCINPEVINIYESKKAEIKITLAEDPEYSDFWYFGVEIYVLDEGMIWPLSLKDDSFFPKSSAIEEALKVIESRINYSVKRKGFNSVYNSIINKIKELNNIYSSISQQMELFA